MPTPAGRSATPAALATVRAILAGCPRGCWWDRNGGATVQFPSLDGAEFTVMADGSVSDAIELDDIDVETAIRRARVAGGMVDV